VDFQIRAWRESSTHVQVLVHASPVGDLRKPVSVAFDSNDRASMQVPVEAHAGEASEVGRRLARVVLPEPVYQQFVEAVRWLGGRPELGLRLRLCLDEELVDLPWEYLYRPDVLMEGVRSGFLLSDSRISLVRESPMAAMAPVPQDSPRKLLFIGTLWKGGEDDWGVAEEYEDLLDAMLPVQNRLVPRFVYTSGDLSLALGQQVDILHYSGHTDAEAGRGYLIREASTERGEVVYSDDLAPRLANAGTRLAVFSACNSGAWSFVRPLLEVGIPTVIGIYGEVTTTSAVEFFSKLYSSLAVGLSLDEALTHARLHLFESGVASYPFDWARFMVYMPADDAVLFPRPEEPLAVEEQEAARSERQKTVSNAYQLISAMDGPEQGRVLSEMAEHRVLILGNFKPERRAILDSMAGHLRTHPRNYQPVIFDFDPPAGRTLGESILILAGLSRFVIADLSEARSLPAELEKILSQFRTLPVVPIIEHGQHAYALFEDLQLSPSVVGPIVEYQGQAHLLERIEVEVVEKAETWLAGRRSRRMRAGATNS
jgi:hypothetical protein